MEKKVVPYKKSKLGKKQQVTHMFDTISENYDRLNRVISLGIDQKWRKKVIRLALENRPTRVLDVATGTGDLAIALAENGEVQVTGLDISPGMLEVGKQKIQQKQLGKQIDMLIGDSEEIPFEDDTFDAVTVAFGVRNFENLEAGLQEISRVLKPKGRIVILETSVPSKTFFRFGYRVYCKNYLPMVGKLLSRDEMAYSYLSESAAQFPHGEEFNNILAKSGFIDIENIPQTFGAATIYTASK